MRTALIANSTAGQHHAGGFSGELDSAAGDLFQDCRWTKAAGDAQRFAKEIALAGGFDAIFVAGGDGTVNEVASGLMQVELKKRPAIGVIPFGTCNVLAGELGIASIDMEGVRTALQSGATRAVDVGSLGSRYFLLMASFGFDAATVRNVALPIKDAIGAPAYVLSAITTLASYKPSEVTVRIDDTVIETKAFMVTVANISSFALQNIKIAPFAAIDDGWLDVCVFEKAPTAKVGLIAQFFMMLARKHLADPSVRYFRARKVDIEAKPVMLGQIDGEPVGQTPVSIELFPKALRFLVPSISEGK